MAVAKSEVQTHIDPLLLEVADVVNTTLDLDTTLRRVAELVRKVIDYEIFGILLLNEKTQELYFRFSVGHQREVAERMRIKLAEGRGHSGGRCRRRFPVYSCAA
jgi:phosphoserine phosphatase RsbU/P